MLASVSSYYRKYFLFQQGIVISFEHFHSISWSQHHCIRSEIFPSKYSPKIMRSFLLPNHLPLDHLDKIELDIKKLTISNSFNDTVMNSERTTICAQKLVDTSQHQKWFFEMYEDVNSFCECSAKKLILCYISFVCELYR